MSKRSTEGRGIKIFIAVMLSIAAVLAVVLFLALGAREGGSEQTAGSSMQAADGNGSGKSGARKGGVKYQAASVLVDQAIERAIRSEGGGAEAEAVRDALRNMPEEDKETVTQIVADHMDTATISEVASDLAGGDTESVMEYARENLSEEELDTLREMAEKYGYEMP